MDSSVHSRRQFLAASGLLGLAGLQTEPLRPSAKQDDGLGHDLDVWLRAIPGIHRLAIDAITLSGGRRALGYATTFQMVNRGAYGLAADAIAAAVVLRDEAAPHAFQSTLWDRFRLGELLRQTDPRDGTPARRNLAAGSAQALIAQGGTIVACGLASRGLAGSIAQRDGRPFAEVWAEVESALLPGARLAPSGITAIQRFALARFAVTAVG